MPLSLFASAWIQSFADLLTFSIAALLISIGSHGQAVAVAVFKYRCDISIIPRNWSLYLGRIANMADVGIYYLRCNCIP